MSTNHTEHYNLSQWERTDKVLMDDFNADNAKIDAALFNHPSGELIAQVTVEEETERLELDVSQLDWSRYMALVLIADTAEYDGFKVRMGSVERCVYTSSRVQNTYSQHSLVDLGDASHMFVLIPVFYDGSHKETGIATTFGFTGIDYVSCLTGGAGMNRLEQCREIAISRNQNKFLPGDRFVLWGVK